MKNRMNFGAIKSSIIIGAMLGGLAVVILDICMLTGTGMETADPLVAGVSMGAGVFVMVASLLLLLNSYYKFGDNDLRVCLAFFVDKIKYENIQSARQNSLTQEVSFVYTTEKKGKENSVETLSVYLKGDKADKFLEELKSHNSEFITEIYTPEPKKKKDKK